MGSQPPPLRSAPRLGPPCPPSPYVGDLENDACTASLALFLMTVLSPCEVGFGPLARKWCYGSGAVAPFKKGDRPAWQLRAASHRGYGGTCAEGVGLHLGCTCGTHLDHFKVRPLPTPQCHMCNSNVS